MDFLHTLNHNGGCDYMPVHLHDVATPVVVSRSLEEVRRWLESC